MLHKGHRILALLCAFTLLLLCSPCAVAEDSAPASGVTYEIFVASFSDHNGDGSGDLLGIIDRLDYLTSLGVDALWLMPVHSSPSYHKYDVTDYESIDPAYGTVEDFESLVSACAEQGIRVMLDLVVNHTSSLHPWFQAACKALAAGEDSPYTDWYHFTQTAGDGYHAAPGAEGWYYEGRFGDHMPDLNLDNAEVRAEIARIMALWQSRGVKGFRLDAVTSYYTGANDSNREFLRFLTETAKVHDPECYLVGEAWADEATILSLYPSGIDSLFNFPAADSTGTLLKAALKGNGATAAVRLAEWQEKVHAANPAAQDAPFLTNHDMGRAAGPLRLGLAQEKAAAMLYLLLPGRPTVYYGEELGMTGSGRDENKRLPMLWSAEDTTQLCNAPADADQNQRLKAGVDVQDADADSLLNCYRAVIRLRAQAPELAHGTMRVLDAENPSVAFYQVTEGDSAVLVAVNASAAETVAFSADVLANADVVGGYGNASKNEENTLTMPPVSCMILRIR